MSIYRTGRCKHVLERSYKDAVYGGMSYQRRAAPLQAMVKRVDGSAFANPTINGLQSFKNPMVPQVNSYTGMNPAMMFWWLKNTQKMDGMPYKPNLWGRK